MIYVMLADGFEEIEALAFVDILRRANIDVNTVSIADTATVKGSHGIEVVADIGCATSVILPFMSVWVIVHEVQRSYRYPLSDE